MNMNSSEIESAYTIQMEGQSQPLIKEGLAHVLFPSSRDVFYNPVQEFNRDMSVAVLRLFAKERRQTKLESCQKKSELEKKESLEASTCQNENFHKDTELIQELCQENEFGCPDESGITILEALAASGLRSIRYAQEIPGVKQVVANDWSNSAVECMKKNIAHNGMQKMITASNSDASFLMYQHRQFGKRFDAVDLDPYGSPHTFLDAAVQCVSDAGILLVTCTDMAVLCGNSPSTCYTKYGALPLKSKACHEMALRIVLQCIESHANRYGRYIVPLMSVSVDFYVRIVVQVFSSQQKCKDSFTKLSWVFQCVGCESWTLQPLGRITVNGKSIKHNLSRGPVVGSRCCHCNCEHVMAGPIWNGPLHDLHFLTRLKESLVSTHFGTYRRMYGMVTLMQEELQDVPLFYKMDKLASVCGVGVCKMVMFRSALLNLGFRVSLSHVCPESLKTDAPTEVIWDVIRAWEKLNPARRDKMNTDKPGRIILEKKISSNISFDLHPLANPKSRQEVLLRFQVNPDKNWGPKARSKTNILSDKDDKKIRNQGKKRSKYSHDQDFVQKLIKGNPDQI